jgi:hypothetical protein
LETFSYKIFSRSYAAAMGRSRSLQVEAGTPRFQDVATDPDYHTILPEYGPREANVYHNQNECYEGKKIKWEHRTSGRGTGRRLCDVCARMA